MGRYCGGRGSYGYRLSGSLSGSRGDLDMKKLRTCLRLVSGGVPWCVCFVRDMRADAGGREGGKEKGRK